MEPSASRISSVSFNTHTYTLPSSETVTPVGQENSYDLHRLKESETVVIMTDKQIGKLLGLDLVTKMV